MNDAAGGAQPSLRPCRVVSVAVQGLAVGVATVTVAVLAAWAVVEIVDARPPYCYSDNPCLPDLGPVGLATLVALIVVAALGPMLAWLRGLPSPLFYAAPTMVVSVLICAVGLVGWPLSGGSVVVILSIVLLSYCVTAVLGLLEEDWHRR